MGSDDSQPDLFLETIATARREGRSPLEALVREGYLTLAEVEEYQRSRRDEPRD